MSAVSEYTNCTYLFVSSSSSSSSWVFCPRAGPSLQAHEPRLQFCRRQDFHRKLRNQGLHFYKGLNRCGGFQLLSTPHSHFSVWIYLKRSEKTPGTPTWRWGEWTNRALRTSPKFTTGVKDQFHKGFWPHQRSGNPNLSSPHLFV